MAKQIMTELDLYAGPIHFCIALNNGINTVGGDSATGKTFLISALKDARASGEIPNVEWIDYTLPPNLIKYSIDQADGKLIVIDNADILLPMCGITKEDIMNDTKNQYLIFTRNGQSYGAELKHIGKFIRQGDTIRIRYLK